MLTGGGEADPHGGQAGPGRRLHILAAAQRPGDDRAAPQVAPRDGHQAQSANEVESPGIKRKGRGRVQVADENHGERGQSRGLYQEGRPLHSLPAD